MSLNEEILFGQTSRLKQDANKLVVAQLWYYHQLDTIAGLD
jgi:hypothetical protein